MKAKHYFNFKYPSVSLLIICFLFTHIPSIAQEVLMAKANKLLTVSYGVSNYDKKSVENYMSKTELDAPSDVSFNYTLKYINPLTITFDYAANDFTTLGLALNYYNYTLNEKRVSSTDTIDIETKGYKLAIQVRGIKYFVQRPRSAFYVLVSPGFRIRTNTYNTTDAYALKVIDIHQTPQTKYEDYSPFSLDAGMGLKFLVTRKIGLSAEFGVMTGLARVGLCYSLKNKWRRIPDNIGW